MPTTPEARTKKEIDKILKRHHVYYVKPVSNGMGRHGISDYICCIRGSFFVIEAKGTDSGKPTPLQQNELAKVQAAGGATFVVTPSTLYGLDTWLTEVEEGKV